MTNFAMTADGKVATRNHTASGFTSSRDKQRLLEIRSLGDALLVGRGTAETDRMSMTLPDESLRAARLSRGQSAHPLRVLISNSGTISPTLNVFSSTASPILVASSEAMDSANREMLAPLATLRLYPGNEVPLPTLLADLAKHYAVRSLVCEGGPTLVKSLLAADLVDEMFVTIAPQIFGGKNAPTMTGLPGDFLPASRCFRLKDFFVENDEAYCHYVRRISL